MTDDTTLDKRSAVLQSTLTLIVERGFHNTPMSLIAKEAGVSAGIIYHYFANKDDLIHQLYKDVKAQLGTAIMSDDLHDLPMREQVKRVWLRSFRFYADHPQEMRFIEQYENSPYYVPVERGDYDPNMQELFALFEAGYEAGLLKPLPAAVMQALTFGVAVSLAKQHHAGSEHFDQQTIDLVAETVCEAILA